MASAHPRKIVPAAAQNGKPCSIEERDGGLCLLVHGWHVPAKLIDVGRPTPRMRQTIRIRQLVRQRQGLVEAGQGLLRIPK